MSYLRAAWLLKYVDAESEDYVFAEARADGKHPTRIEDYGKISDNGFIELLCLHWDTKDKLFKRHLIRRLAKRLNVKLRKKPLSRDEYIKLNDIKHKKFIKKLEKEHPDWFRVKKWRNR